MRIVGGAAVADDDVGAAVEDRRDDPGDILSDILTVGVGVDDDVGARRERGIDARAECGGETAVGAVAYDMVHAPHARDLCRIVGAAVVDDEDFDRVDTVDLAGQGRERRGEVFGLVQTGNLDDELHRATLRRVAIDADRPAADFPHPP